MSDLFGNPTNEGHEEEHDPNPNDLTEGDVVRISHKDRTGFLRTIEGQGVGWVDSDKSTATGWYPLVALELE